MYSYGHIAHSGKLDRLDLLVPSREQGIMPYNLYMVVWINSETPIYTPKYYSAYYGDPETGTPNSWKPPYSICLTLNPKPFYPAKNQY